MIEISYSDNNLFALQGVVLRSALSPDVTYQLDQALGAGSMAVAFRAVRRAPDGQSFAVVKVVHPELLMESSELALLTIRKESVALGRLNEQVPPTPFVVRLLETNELTVSYRGSTLELPWLAVEYVHGGTLEERIADSIARTGYAFEPERAAPCVAALANGLRAIHQVGVIHRDIKPSNILCCGSGADELFKIADFGVARAQGLKQTFVQSALGTPGFAAPEQILMEDDKIGTATDVFALASTTFALLTGEELFPARSISEILMAVKSKKRRSIRECARLSLDLRDQPSVCAALDAAIAHATARDAEDRPQSAMGFATAITAALRAGFGRGPTSVSRWSSKARSSDPSNLGRWNFHVRHAPGDARAIWSVAWDASGCAMVATTAGVEFWDGMRWAKLPVGTSAREQIRVVYHLGGGEWLLGGPGAELTVYREGELKAVPGRREVLNLSALSGDFSDVAVVSARLHDGQQAVLACVGQRWLKPFPLPDILALPALVRVGDERWLVAGRQRSGGAFLASFMPLEGQLERLTPDPIRAYLAGASSAEAGLGAVVGAEGKVVLVQDGEMSRSSLPERADLSAAVVDPTGRAWVASLGKLWACAPKQNERWQCVWQDATWNVPIVGMYSDGKRLLAIGADGGMVEGLKEG